MSCPEVTAVCQSGALVGQLTRIGLTCVTYTVACAALSKRSVSPSGRRVSQQKRTHLDSAHRESRRFFSLGAGTGDSSTCAGPRCIRDQVQVRQ